MDLMATTQMAKALADNLDQIAAICARHGVAWLYAFGSAVRDDYREGESDIDLLVELGPMQPYARVEAYFGMLDELRSLLGGRVDLVMAGAVKNPYIARDIERTKRMVYAA